MFTMTKLMLSIWLKTRFLQWFPTLLLLRPSMVSGGRTLILFGRCQSSRLTGLWCQCPAEDPGTETRIPLHWWPGLSKSFSVCLFIFIWALCVIVFASSVTGFSWPAEAMGSCWSCLYRDPIRDNHLTKFKVRNPPKSCMFFFFLLT